MYNNTVVEMKNYLQMHWYAQCKIWKSENWYAGLPFSRVILAAA